MFKKKPNLNTPRYTLYSTLIIEQARTGIQYTKRGSN